MNITLQYFDSCPGWKVADSRLKTIIKERDLDINFQLQRIETLEGAEKHQFAGFPTLLIDGRDPFTTGDMPIGLACRTYWTEDGLAPSPSLEQLEAALGF